MGSSATMQFDTFSMVLLVGRADAPPEASSDEVQDAHLAHLADLQASGEMLAAGPVAGEGDVRIRGLCLFAVDAARANELMAEDPAVRAGRFDVQVLPWHVPAGALTAGRGRLPRSIADVRSDG